MKTPPDDLAAGLLARSEWLLGDDPPPFAEIAREMGVSRAALYYYFAGQDDLLAFLVSTHARNGADQMAEAVDDSSPPAVQLRQTVSAMIGFLGTNPGVCSGLLRAAGGRMSVVLAANDAHVGHQLRAVLRGCLEAGVARFDDSHTAADWMTGAALMAVLGRVGRGQDPTDENFVEDVTVQIIGGLVTV